MAHKSETSTEVRQYGNEKIEVIYRKLRPSKESGGRYPDLVPCTTVKNGILMERDVAVPMRDGIILYTELIFTVLKEPLIYPLSWLGAHTGKVCLI